jgi:hypothetical protein
VFSKNYLGQARIWIVGDKPDWYCGLHVPLPRIVCSGDRARLDRAHKFYHIATQTPEINERFVAMQDDVYLINPVSCFDLNRRWINDKPLTPEMVENWDPKHGYAKQKKSTALKLFENGIRYVSDYSTHTPKYYFKDDLKAVIDHYDLLRTPLVCTILFDNAIQRCDPPFPIQPYRVRLKSIDHSAEDLLALCQSKIFLNHLEQSWTPETERALTTLFPEPSIVEKIQ